MNITLGCDPEVFMINPNTGKFVSAFGKIQGTKYQPFKVSKGAVQVDGNALEFNIDPASTKQEFIGNIKEVYQQLQKMVPGFNLAIEPTAVFDKDYFDELPLEARMLGCDPDYDAWTRSENPKPETEEPMRTAGGHIHIGWRGGETGLALADLQDPNHFDDCCEIAKQMDYYLGIWSLGIDKDSQRRSLYGRAGTFRPKPYGCEYRALSNFWIKTDELIEWVYDQTQLAMKDAFNKKLAFQIYKDSARQFINGNMYDWPHQIHVDGLGNPPPGAKFESKKKLRGVPPLQFIGQ